MIDDTEFEVPVPAASLARTRAWSGARGPRRLNPEGPVAVFGGGGAEWSRVENWDRWSGVQIEGKLQVANSGASISKGSCRIKFG